jgi:hypothetical protein
MLRNTAESYSSEPARQGQSEPSRQGQKVRRDSSLTIILWSLWTLAVAGTAFWHWRSDIVAQQPVNMLGLVIYSALTGLVGMLVLTLIELWLEPLRFID